MDGWMDGTSTRRTLKQLQKSVTHTDKTDAL